MGASESVEEGETPHVACKMLLPFLGREKDEDCPFPSPQRVPAAGTALAAALLPPASSAGRMGQGWRGARGQGVQREHLLKSNPHLGRTCYQTCGVPKRKTHESYGKASWFKPIPCTLGSLADRFVAPGVGIVASSQKEPVKCTFSRRFWEES